MMYGGAAAVGTTPGMPPPPSPDAGGRSMYEGGGAYVGASCGGGAYVGIAGGTSGSAGPSPPAGPSSIPRGGAGARRSLAALQSSTNLRTEATHGSGGATRLARRQELTMRAPRAQGRRVHSHRHLPYLDFSAKSSGRVPSSVNCLHASKILAAARKSLATCSPWLPERSESSAFWNSSLATFSTCETKQGVPSEREESGWGTRVRPGY